MCVICDGWSEEELLSEEFVRIAIHGFTMMGVEGSPTWTYTIGVQQSFDHPELVVTGLPFPAATELLTMVVDHIREGERFTPDSPPLSPCDWTTVAFGGVDPEQWNNGWFDQWLRYYDWIGGAPPRPEAVQVLWPDRAGRFPPDLGFCPSHRGACQPTLDGEHGQRRPR